VPKFQRSFSIQKISAVGKKQTNRNPLLGKNGVRGLANRAHLIHGGQARRVDFDQQLKVVDSSERASREKKRVPVTGPRLLCRLDGAADMGERILRAINFVRRRVDQQNFSGDRFKWTANALGNNPSVP